jgi:hypothetical protein
MVLLEAFLFLFLIITKSRLEATCMIYSFSLLITMLAARTLSQTTEPLYGCFVLGKLWHFVYLEGNEYCVSEGFDATGERELTIIWLVLEKTKKMIAAKCGETVLE